MRLKTRYRQAFRDGGRVDPTGPAELPIEPSIEQPGETASAPAPEAPAPIVDNPAPEQSEPPPPPEQPQQDGATLALKKQIADLRQSEKMRQQAAQAAMPQQQSMTREQRLEAWQQHGGLSPDEVQFFRNHPEMLDHPDLIAIAASQAQQAGVGRGTHEHLAFVEKAFSAQVEHLMRQPESPAMQTPEFFRPPPARTASPSPSSVVSAPVSRSVPNASGKRHSAPGKITLTPQEVEAARLSGISVETYAREKLRYQGMREDGSYRDARDER